MAWCQKAGIALADASTAGTPPSAATLAARALVKRWFVGGDSVSEDDLNGFITTLSRGFKDLIAAVGQGNFALTDFVPLRNSTSADERKFFDSEAFTMRSRYEGMAVVDIERISSRAMRAG